MGISEIQHNILKANDMILITNEINKVIKSLDRCKNPKMKKLLKNKMDLLMKKDNEYLEKSYQLTTKDKKRFFNNEDL